MKEFKLIQSAGLLLGKILEVIEGMGSMKIPAGKYLIGHFDLADEDFKKKAWDGMSSWMLDNALESRDAYFFEKFYSDSLFHCGQNHQIDIYVPIK